MRTSTILLAALVAATLVSQPANAKGKRKKKQCQHHEMRLDPDLAIKKSLYADAIQEDLGDNCQSFQEAFYREQNPIITKLLRKYGCTWRDLKLPIPSKVTSKEDLCPEDDLPLVPLVKIGPGGDVPEPAVCNIDAILLETGVPREKHVIPVYRDAVKFGKEHCDMVDMKQFHSWNPQIDTILTKHNCSWAELKLQRIEKLADLGCPEPPPEEDSPEELKTEKLPPLEKLPIPPPTVTKRSEPSHWLTWTGVAISGAGLAAMGAGIYFGKEASDYESQAHAHDASQVDVHRFNGLAQDNAQTANILYIVGGIVVTAGVTLVVIDLVAPDSPDDPPNKPTTSVGVGVTPTGANLTVHW